MIALGINAGALWESKMTYDRDEMRRSGREARPRFNDDRERERGFRGDDREERGFFERAGEQIASWFGDEDDDDRGPRREEQMRRDRPLGREHERGYRPLAGDYGRAETGRGEPLRGQGRDRDAMRRPVTGGSDRSQHDPHYSEWRQRQIDALDRDYDEYRREHQSKFENDFGGWRNRRQSKREMLGEIRAHMDVLGNDEQPVGTVDRVVGDRIILTKSDPESGGAHHSLPCTMIERIDGERVILDTSAEQAKKQWRDENRDRALFEREDQGEAGPHMLDRSFSGTYR